MMQFYLHKMKVTFSAGQSGWGSVRCQSEWQSHQYSLHREYRSRILSTPSSDTLTLFGSPQMSSCQSALSHPSFWILIYIIFFTVYYYMSSSAMWQVEFDKTFELEPLFTKEQRRNFLCCHWAILLCFVKIGKYSFMPKTHSSKFAG